MLPAFMVSAAVGGRGTKPGEGKTNTHPGQALLFNRRQQDAKSNHTWDFDYGAKTAYVGEGVRKSFPSWMYIYQANTQLNPEIARASISQWESLLSSLRALFDQCWVCCAPTGSVLTHHWQAPPPILPSCGEVKGGVWGVEDCVSSGPIKGPLCSPCVRSLIGCAAAVTQRHTVSSAHGQCSLKHTQVHICYCLRQPHHSTYNGQHWNPTELVQLTNTERKVLRWWIICRIVRT